MGNCCKKSSKANFQQPHAEVNASSGEGREREVSIAEATRQETGEVEAPSENPQDTSEVGREVASPRDNTGKPRPVMVDRAVQEDSPYTDGAKDPKAWKSTINDIFDEFGGDDFNAPTAGPALPDIRKNRGVVHMQISQDGELTLEDDILGHPKKSAKKKGKK